MKRKTEDNHELSRRDVLGGSVKGLALAGTAAAGAGGAVVGTTALTREAQAGDRFGFAQVAANTDDTITVPEGF